MECFKDMVDTGFGSYEYMALDRSGVVFESDGKIHTQY